jgi:hypothetical protein
MQSYNCTFHIDPARWVLCDKLNFSYVLADWNTDMDVTFRDLLTKITWRAITPDLKDDLDFCCPYVMRGNIIKLETRPSGEEELVVDRSNFNIHTAMVFNCHCIGIVLRALSDGKHKVHPHLTHHKATDR